MCEKMEFIKITDQLADILKEKNLSKISFKNKDVSICVEAQGLPVMPPMPPMPPMPGFPPLNSQVPAFVPQAGNESANQSAPVGNYIKSPIVGTFYSAPAPDKPPFVKVGDKVVKGQVVCIVESMKLMNEINSEFDGTVAAVLALDGEAVDFGKELIEII
jgi:acetyl-CoA carboxylase biotin carboxyl carrier protein